MTTDWRSFADTVDRICALSWNYMQVEWARTEQRIQAHGLSNPRAEAADVRLLAEEDQRIHSATARIGEPPARPVLYQRWRQNVATRTTLFFDASAAARQGRFDEENRIFDRIDRLKHRSDALGQRFGLRICTSNK